MAMHMKDTVFWDVILCSLVDYRRFERFYSIVQFYIGIVKAVDSCKTPENLCQNTRQVADGFIFRAVLLPCRPSFKPDRPVKSCFFMVYLSTLSLASHVV
jgi:hypothetical protein